MASHELRSPLTSVAGFAQMLDRRWEDLDEARRREMAGRVHERSARIVRLTDDLLAMSRLDAEALQTRREPVVVAEAARRVVEDLEDRVGVEVRIPDDFARADPAEKTGTGLGLAIVRGLARANGGEAFYEPNVPEGSRFGVRLPVVDVRE